MRPTALKCRSAGGRVSSERAAMASQRQASKIHMTRYTPARATKAGAFNHQCLGASAGELITLWTLAISRRLNIRAVAGIVVPYPTLSEAGKRAAMTYFTPGLTSPWVRRILGFLRRLG